MSSSTTVSYEYGLSLLRFFADFTRCVAFLYSLCCFSLTMLQVSVYSVYYKLIIFITNKSLFCLLPELQLRRCSHPVDSNRLDDRVPSPRLPIFRLPILGCHSVTVLVHLLASALPIAATLRVACAHIKCAHAAGAKVRALRSRPGPEGAGERRLHLAPQRRPTNRPLSGSAKCKTPNFTQSMKIALPTTTICSQP